MSQKVGAKFSRIYDSVVERTTKRRYSMVSIRDAFLVHQVGTPSPISVSRQPHNNGQPFGAEDDLGLSVQLRLDGYCVAPIRWFRDRGIDPVAMRDEDREYRETFSSIIRRSFRRWPEFKWRLLHPTGKRAIDVERI